MVFGRQGPVGGGTQCRPPRALHVGIERQEVPGITRVGHSCLVN